MSVQSQTAQAPPPWLRQLNESEYEDVKPLSERHATRPRRPSCTETCSRASPAPSPIPHPNSAQDCACAAGAPMWRRLPAWRRHTSAHDADDLPRKRNHEGAPGRGSSRVAATAQGSRERVHVFAGETCKRHAPEGAQKPGPDSRKPRVG